MGDITNLQTVNFLSTLISVFVIIAGIKGIVTLTEWAAQKLGIELKWKREKEADHTLLMTTSRQLQELQAQVEQDKKASEERDAEISSALSQISETLNSLVATVELINKRSIAAEDASRESLGDRIAQKYRHYLSLGGVPEDELDEFINLHKAYNGVKGNHSGDAKFNYCINNLPILLSQVKLNFDEEEQ